MADADQLMAVLPRVAGVSYIGLVMNQRGLEAVTAELKRRDLIGRLNGSAGADKPKAKAGPVDDWSPILPVPDGTPEPAFTPPTR